MTTKINYTPELKEFFKTFTDKKLDRRWYLVVEKDGVNKLTYSLCQKLINVTDEDIEEMIKEESKNMYDNEDFEEEQVINLMRELRQRYEIFIKEIMDDQS
jgi:hypothetical protein